MAPISAVVPRQSKVKSAALTFVTGSLKLTSKVAWEASIVLAPTHVIEDTTGGASIT